MANVYKLFLEFIFIFKEKQCALIYKGFAEDNMGIGGT